MHRTGFFGITEKSREERVLAGNGLVEDILFEVNGNTHAARR